MYSEAKLLFCSYTHYVIWQSAISIKPHCDLNPTVVTMLSISLCQWLNNKRLYSRCRCCQITCLLAFLTGKFNLIIHLLSQEIAFPKMVASCCRFLCYFCRISRQNQKAMFDHLSYLLENSSVGLGEFLNVCLGICQHCCIRSVLYVPRLSYIKGKQLKVDQPAHESNMTIFQFS